MEHSCTVTQEEVLTALSNQPLTMSELKSQLRKEKGGNALINKGCSFDLSFALTTDDMFSNGALILNRDAKLEGSQAWA